MEKVFVEFNGLWHRTRDQEVLHLAIPLSYKASCSLVTK